jgi:hypothetical protein
MRHVSADTPPVIVGLWRDARGEMYVKVAGAAARRFFIRALEHGRCPTEVTTIKLPRIRE